jgi:hypothetical protein
VAEEREDRDESEPDVEGDDYRLWPMENASTCPVVATPAQANTSRPCWAPTPPGANGSTADTESITATRERIAQRRRVPNAASKKYATPIRII